MLNYIWSADDLPSAILLAPGKLQDKYCRIIKEKFTGFNREIEDISSTQKKYSIPDVELRESLKRDNKEYILPKYNSFYDKYVNVQFSKSTEKYVRYTPAQVSSSSSPSTSSRGPPPPLPPPPTRRPRSPAS